MTINPIWQGFKRRSRSTIRVWSQATQSFIGLIALASWLSGCTSTRLVSFPFEPNGRGLNSTAAEMNPAIAGRFIVFASDRRGSQDIYLYDTVNRGLIDLPGINSLDLVESHPAVSEDGRYIVFEGAREGRSSIYLYDRDLRQSRNLTETLKATTRNPTISANGNAIAFEANSGGKWSIMLVNRQGQPINGYAPP